MKESNLDQSAVLYNPNQGFIGQAEVKVSNYIFSANRRRKAYQFAKPVAHQILSHSVSKHYQESKRLTQFLKKRDLTFSKKTSSGEYKTFAVPCTTTVVPLQKSVFNQMEEASQRLMISLRKVLQNIYGAKSIRDASFVKSLPKDVREIFIKAIEDSAHYYPQLHHPNMKKYPFFDIVGLDLVLVEDYLEKSKSNQLPFRILELNAGSPSGASNNMNVLEGINQYAPEMLVTLGKVMPNDHFEVLGQTYKSLGEDWTNRTDGIQIILPPGGQNGAAPEIHQLATYSGLVYADPDQLYQDTEGYIRLRTVGEINPIVTAIYSRVNTDSALFDPDKNLILRDADTGEAFYLRDNLKLDKNGMGELIKDKNGNPIPLRSIYAIPGSIDAIINRKMYMGGLNRILDNKIILATLTHYAPKFYAKDIQKAGLKLNGSNILPPQTLPPTAKSVDIIKQNPDEWVIKAPNLAGGQGVYIMKTLPEAQKQEVIEMIEKRPTEFAYQQLVKIGRIPVAVSRKNDGFRFANLAADLRIWVFYGGKNSLPKMTHNALVRYAPQERGKMSSIVNTSAGGGYAPFVIVDDTNNPKAVDAKELAKPMKAIDLPCELPLFAGAQVVQIARMLNRVNTILKEDKCSLYKLYGQVLGIKTQLKEIISFLHPKAMEKISNALDIIDSKQNKAEIAAFYLKINNNQMRFVEKMQILSKKLTYDFIDIIENIRVLNIHVVNEYYSDEERAHDYYLLNELEILGKKQFNNDKKSLKTLKEIISILKDSIHSEFPHVYAHARTKKVVRQELIEFCQISAERLNAGKMTKEFSKILNLENNTSELEFETLFLGKKDIDKKIVIATQAEMATKELISQSEVSVELQTIKNSWQEIIAESKKIKASQRPMFIAQMRKKHFAKFPKLERYQSLMEKTHPTKNDLIELLDIMPYAKFNIANFAKELNLSIKDIFSSSLKPNRIAILDQKVLTKEKLDGREYAGECFAKKKSMHGLYSDSDIFIWLRSELPAFTLLYTAGHEIIHYHQIKNSMQAEKRSLKDGGLSFAKFINYYGNFLGANQRTVDRIDYDIVSLRKPAYGYADRAFKDFFGPVITELRHALYKSDASWNKKLESYGSTLGHMMPNSPGVRVKALQEVIPALENAKNILFAQDLGLEVPYDAVKSALPTANREQLKIYKPIIMAAALSSEVNWEALRIIASHQYYGVTFCRADFDQENLTLRPVVETIAVGASYNQTQQ